MRGHSDAWPTSLRALRANRPPLAKRGARGQLFSAGLEQAEQFWMAANSVGPETRPLLLFYGLGQAGQALCAAAATKPSAGHGLTFKMVDGQVPGSGVTVFEVVGGLYLSGLQG
ncbi:YaaC family protein, partial [Micrococcus luteus]|uniref:YaaC family protein n=1 Tax=Micrococcus luteus TaxID=1270 RepID=UPI00387985EC